MVSRPWGISDTSGVMTAASTASATTSTGSVRPISRFSMRLIENRRGTCGVYADLGGMKNRSGCSTISPFQETVPPSAFTNPRIERSKVVLPAPTRPVITVNDPAGTENDTSLIPSSVPG